MAEVPNAVLGSQGLLDIADELGVVHGGSTDGNGVGTGGQDAAGVGGVGDAAAGDKELALTF